MSDDTLEVEALITEWRTGKHGLYAFIRVLSADTPAKTAICGRDVKGVLPPIDTPFRCRIGRADRGWRVTELIVGGLPHELTGVTGVVRMGPAPSGRKIWTIETEPLLGEVAVITELDARFLWAVHLAEIDIGTQVRFDAERGARGYEVTKLLHPTAAEAFPSGPSDMPRQTVVVLVQKDWTVDDPKGVSVRMRSDAGAPVAASAFVRASMLRAAGLKRLFRASGSTPPPKAESEELLSKWEMMLHSADRDTRDGIEIDRLELEVEWVASSSEWRAERLLRPRALRRPTGSGEVVDWVHGTVLGNPRKMASVAPRAEPMQEKEDGAEGRGTAGLQEQRMAVDVEYEDARVGCGTTDLRLAEHKVQAAGLAPGVPVIVCLKAHEEYWNITALHRSCPEGAVP